MAPNMIIRTVFTANQLVAGRSRRLNKAARRLNSESGLVGSISEGSRNGNVLIARRVGIRVWLVPWIIIINIGVVP